MLLEFLGNLDNTTHYSQRNTELDIFCHHAPLGLQFPDMFNYPSARSFEHLCKNDTFSKIMQTSAGGYRNQVWAPYQDETYL